MDMNPGWKYKMWDDEGLRNFVRIEFPKFLPVYDSYPSQIFRVDAARYLVLKRQGGVFADLDMACLKPLDQLAGYLDHAVFGKQWDGPTIENGIVCNALMASPPEHPLWDRIVGSLNVRSGIRQVLGATGPNFLTDYILNYQGTDVRIFDPTTFHPVRWNAPEKADLLSLPLSEIQSRYPHSFTISHWAGSWK